MTTVLQGARAAEVTPAQGVPGRAGGWRQPLAPWLTQSKVRHRLHLTEVPRSTVDDAQVGPATLREQHHFGPPRKGPKAGAGDDAQPVVAGTL